MTQSSYQTGQRGEQAAQSLLRQKHFTVIAANWRSPHISEKLGELDIIAQHASLPLLVFVEVKTRKTNRYGAPIEAVSPRKQQQILTLAEIFLSLHPEFQSFEIRFDVVSIYYPGFGQPAQVQHWENAFDFS